MKYWTSTVLALTAGIFIIAIHQLFVYGIKGSYFMFMLVAMSFLFYQFLKRGEAEAEKRAAAKAENQKRTPPAKNAKGKKHA